MTAATDQQTGIRIPLCWDYDTASATIKTEAVSPSAAVFFATHVPLHIRRRHPDLRDADNAEEVTEEDVQKDFLSRRLPVGVLLMPVIGESGTGKSHLVRWIAERTKSDDKRAVVYVEKAKTSLRGLIRTLLERDDVDSPELKKLRDKVDDFAATIDEGVLQRQLIAALADYIAQADGGTDQYRRALVGSGKLELYLRDVYVQQHLMREGALIPRLAASLLSDRVDGQTDRPTEFQVEDLPEITKIENAAAPVRNLARILSGRAPMQKAAAELLTEALSPAVQTVFGMGGGQLQEALLTIRREYLLQRKEIILLIEDFAVIQGVQRDLLDALIEPGIREGAKVLAPVRTLMAVTTGYYQRLAETVITRVQAATPYVYDLDVSFDTSEQGRSDTIEFVGRYMNAARLGTEVLADSGVAAGEPVPNKCTDCEFRKPCHGAFGASENGFGIFPLNWSSLRRAVHARPVPGNNVDAFNARIVIGEVILPVLEESAPIADGEFPGKHFKTTFPLVDTERALRPEVEVAINELDAKDAIRRKILLEYWGDAPDRLVNLDQTIHATFQLPVLDLDEKPYVPPVEDRQPTEDSKTVKQKAIPASVQKALTDIDDWAAQRHPLSQNTAGKIRGLVSQAVLNRSPWNQPLTAEPDAELKRRAWPAKSTVVSIEGADGEGLAGTADAAIKFSRSAENSVFFKGLIAADAGLPNATAPNKAMRRLARIAEKYAPVAQAEVVRARDARDETMAGWISASLLGAALCGQAWPRMTDEKLVAAVFDDGRGWELHDRAFRSAAWDKFYTEHRRTRQDLVTELRKLVGIRRGTTGDVRMIDAARVIPMLREVAKTWLWKPPSPMPAKLRPVAGGSGFAQLPQLVQAHVADLRPINDTLARLLPEGTTGTETLDAVKEAFEHAQGTGLGPTSITDPVEFLKRLNALRDADWSSVARLRGDLKAIDDVADGPERQLAELKAAAVDRGRDLPAILDFLRICDEWFDTRLGGSTKQIDAEQVARDKVQAMITRWRKVVGAQ